MNNEEKILEMLAKMDERQTRTEKMLGQMQADMAKMQKDVASVRLDIENRIDPTLQALAEGQKTILETLAPKSRVEALEEEVEFLKSIIKLHTSQINDLRKAQ